MECEADAKPRAPGTRPNPRRVSFLEMAMRSGQDQRHLLHESNEEEAENEEIVVDLSGERPAIKLRERRIIFLRNGNTRLL
ncbi:hypothetical protein Nepgr_011495 [Nepenthes gracilis]|uniref:Uncharacterized protein n=1 Tax=Nepenthes gracilis TaxID=150966 RepID=A0AAD3SEZ3_NEPGR|nr:hypothetical protein Nepgr_011495 [Nepenthes gracilis]